MFRVLCLLLAASLAVASATGCRSCDSCHDYDPPVANCDCNAYGTHRAGSVSGGYVTPHPDAQYEEVFEEESAPAVEQPAVRSGQAW